METQTRIVILRHVLEYWRSSNTARIAMLALGNAELHEYASPDGQLEESIFLRPGTWLLFPGASQHEPPTEVPKQLIVVDGSWSQTRRMVQRFPPLRRLPRLSLPEPAHARRRLRQGQLPDERSTLEAIADAVGLLESAERGGVLHALHDLFVERVLAVRQGGGGSRLSQ